MSETAGLQEFGHFFEVKLELFDGPIDLLLHLVKKNELPIEKVALAEVAAQYFACIEAMRDYDLEVAGEYLVIAATLLSIKSSILLNEPVELVIDEDGNLIDPHEELLRQLREAQVYRDGALYLSGREMLGLDVFSPISTVNQFGQPPIRFKDHDPMLLGIAFKRLIDRAGPEKAGITISFDSVSVVDRMMRIIETLRSSGGRLPFQKLVPDLTSRAAIISSFIALLELCKRQVISVHQEEACAEIEIVLSAAPEAVATTEMSSEFDEENKESVSVNG